MRIKRMPEDQFREIINRNWAPVQVAGEAIPTFLQHIPSEILHSVYVSGGPYTDVVNSGGAISAGELIGGIDVYRNAPDDRVALNKDWYAVIRTTDTDAYFLVSGPIKDNEHWLDEIPTRLKNVEILSVPPLSRATNLVNKEDL